MKCAVAFISVIYLIKNGINGKDAFNGLRSYTLSYRYREQFLHSWLYYEIEPFLEYRELRQYNDEVGIALRFIGYYGQ